MHTIDYISRRIDPIPNTNYSLLSMATQEQFEAAVTKSKTLTTRPGNDDLLSLYALYKQATDGDVSGNRPGGFDFKAIAKYDAWATRKGKSEEEAKQEYVNLVDKLANNQ
jgi:diazepam-binding inhibitor (GABA receptor modulating acyl-CoA-binding protein)